MFRYSTPQQSMWEPSFLLTDEDVEAIEKTWAHVFREKALPLIDEGLFAHMYSADMGRPNRPVKTLLGVLVLKEMFNRTDMEALDQLRWHDLWHHALAIDRTQARLAQKTLHNFRVRLMQHDAAKLAFIDITDRMLRAGGISEATVFAVKPKRRELRPPWRAERAKAGSA